MDNSVMDNVSDTTQAQVQETAQQAQERLFKQSELNEIVGRAKHDAVESYKRQHQSQHAQQAPQSSQTQSSKEIGRASCRERVCQYV